MLVPKDSAVEPAVVNGLPVAPIQNLRDAVDLFQNAVRIQQRKGSVAALTNLFPLPEMPMSRVMPASNVVWAAVFHRDSVFV